MNFTATITWMVDLDAETPQEAQTQAFSLAENLTNGIYIDNELYSGLADPDSIEWTDAAGQTCREQWAQQSASPKPGPYPPKPEANSRWSCLKNLLKGKAS